MKDLALHILDILQNSVAAGARHIETCISEDPEHGKYMLTITDDGKGMDAEKLSKAADPFYTTRTTRKVGLGLSLLKQNAERTGGSFSMQSEPGKGTKVAAVFAFGHPDLLPPGDIAGTMALTAAGHPAIDFRYEHSTPKGTYVFDTQEIKQVLQGTEISRPEVITFMREMINENLFEIRTL